MKFESPTSIYKTSFKRFLPGSRSLSAATYNLWPLTSDLHMGIYEGSAQQDIKTLLLVVSQYY